MNILGISAFYHDAAACLVQDGNIIAAAHEERFSRVKHDARFPAGATAYCLREGKITAADIDIVCYYDKPLLTFERLMETYLAYAPRGIRSFSKALPLWLHHKLHIPREIKRGLGGDFKGKILFSQHHLSHAASAFYPSPFERAAILTIDGVGEWSTTTIGKGAGNKIEILKEIRFPHSLGLLYSAFTYYLGFTVNSGEYKLMGLAPYGEPKYADLILEKLIDVKDDGSFWMDMSYFNYCSGLRMTSKKFHALFGMEPKQPGAPFEQKHLDIAASIQEVTNQIMLKLAIHIRELTGESRLCLAGGVALNSVANGLIRRAGIFEDIWIQPAAGDAGGALGAALAAWHLHLGNGPSPNPTDSQQGSLLGPSYSGDEIRRCLNRIGAKYSQLSYEDAAKRIAEALDQTACRGAGARTHGIRSARAGCSQYPCRCPLERNPVATESQDQVPGVVPTLCSGSIAGRCRRLFRRRILQPVHALGRASQRVNSQERRLLPTNRFRASTASSGQSLRYQRSPMSTSAGDYRRSPKSAMATSMT